jgi:hypothetical protein
LELGGPCALASGAACGRHHAPLSVAFSVAPFSMA